ncbi:unnamed protein product, partial [Prorocentrum cordatum]
MSVSMWSCTSESDEEMALVSSSSDSDEEMALAREMEMVIVKTMARTRRFNLQEAPRGPITPSLAPDRAAASKEAFGIRQLANASRGLANMELDCIVIRNLRSSGKALIGYSRKRIPPTGTVAGALAGSPAVGQRRHCRAWGCWITRLHWLLALLLRAALAGRKQAAPTASALRGERARRAQELAAAAAPVLGLSLLERLAVRPSTEKLYRGALSAFASFCARRRLDWTDHASLDSVLVQYMDSEFLLGGGGNMGNVLLAAVAHFLGSLHKRAATQLPRARRAAAAWARRAPGRARLPLPRRVVFAIAGVLLRDGHSRLAICIFVMFACYLRPGEAAKLRGRHLIAPSASAGTLYQYFGLLLHESGKGPGRTGVNDESILFDRDGWLAPLLAALKLSALPDQPLWGEAIAQLPKLFDSACRELSLERLRPHLYSLRHGGASDDMLSQRRSLPEIQRRGRWRSAKSLNRYTKETKLLDELAWIPPAALELGAFVEDNLMALVEGSLPALLATGRVPAGAAGLLGRRLRRRPVLELFCGAGTIARAMVALGFAAFGLDWSRSPLEDHVAATFQTVVLGWIQSRAVGAVWLGTPCASWARALRRPLRSALHPLGLPDLNAHEQAGVGAGNATYRFTLR